MKRFRRLYMLRMVQSAAYIAFATASGTAFAQDVVNYAYDSLGRVVAVNHTSGPLAGTSTIYTYDTAGNRTQLTVSNSPNGSGSSPNLDNGASVPSVTYIIFPLNGYTVVPIYN